MSPPFQGCGLDMLGHRLPSATSNPHRTTSLRLCLWKPDSYRRRLPPASTILISIHDAADSSMHAPIVLIQGLAFFCFPIVPWFRIHIASYIPKALHYKNMAWFAYLVFSPQGYRVAALQPWKPLLVPTSEKIRVRPQPHPNGIRHDD